MKLVKVALLLTRALQILIAILVLALSISLVQNLSNAKHDCSSSRADACGDWLNPWKSYFVFSAAVGVIGLLDALVGMASVFLSVIAWVAIIIVDFLTVIFYLIGGLIIAVKSSHEKQPRPCGKIAGDTDDWENVLAPCSRFTATNVFVFMGVIAAIAAMVLIFMNRQMSGFKGTGSTAISRQL